MCSLQKKTKHAHFKNLCYTVYTAVRVVSSLFGNLSEKLLMTFLTEVSMNGNVIHRLPRKMGNIIINLELHTKSD